MHHFPTVVPTRRAVQIWGAGPTARRWAKALRARGYTIRRFVDVTPRRLGRRVQNTPVEAPQHLAADDGFILAAVGLPGARECIETYLHDRGFRPWDDYLAVA